MNIYEKHIIIFTVDLFIVLLLSTKALTATNIYILSNDSAQKTNCDFLELKNNVALCTANNLIISFDTSNIKYIEVVRNGTSQQFQKFTPEITNTINRLNSDKSATKKIREQRQNKIFDFIPYSVQSVIKKIKIQRGNNATHTTVAIIGLIIFLTGSIGFLIAAFRAGILWGLSCMFLPFVSLIFLFLHWKTAAKPFLISILGISILFLTTMFSPTSGTGRDISRFNSGIKRTRTYSNNAAFKCSGKIYCSEMSSCAEAKFYLRNCPGTKMDGDNDGIPCENQWCGN